MAKAEASVEELISMIERGQLSSSDKICCSSHDLFLEY